MNKLLTAVLTVIIVPLSFLACTKKTQRNSDACRPNPAIGEIAKSKKGTGKVLSETAVSCVGNCGGNDCHLEGVMAGNDTYVQCSCNNCTMSVTVSKTDSNGVTATDTTNIPGGHVAVDYFQHFQDYMAAEYVGQTFVITKISMIDDGPNDNYIVQYEYLTRDGTAGTIMFENQGITGKNISVDCKGKCDCRERYYPTTGAIECTCKDCSMEIKDIPDTK